MKREEQLALKKAEYEGKTFKTKHNDSVVVLEYISSVKIKVKLCSSGEVKLASAYQIRNGLITNITTTPRVFLTDDVSKTLRKRARHKHRGMFDRCSSKDSATNYPTYVDCTISEGFKDLNFFYEWCLEQVGFANNKWHLDKDILVKGNREYGDQTCCFVPEEINLMFVTQKSNRGVLPIGVSYCKPFNLYQAKVRKNNKTVDLGFYCTPEEAFYAYKQAKEDYIKEVANKWKDQIDTRVYEALMNWTIEITD